MKKPNLCAVFAAISLFISPCVLADPYDDTGSGNGVVTGSDAMNQGDSNGLVQGSGTMEGQNASDNPPLTDTTQGASGAGISRDGETMGEED